GVDGIHANQAIGGGDTVSGDGDPTKTGDANLPSGDTTLGDSQPPGDSTPPLGPCGNLLRQADANVDGFLTDTFRWFDARCTQRSAAMVHSDITDPTGHQGGYLRRYTYTTNGQTRVCDGASNTHPGWGYAVNHFGNGGVNATLSYSYPGSQSVVFLGSHHAIYRYVMTYAVDYSHNVRVTIDWFFATGRDHPVWSITYDLAATGIGANVVNADTRSPYGDLQWDGGAGALVDGVAWGDRYRFTTTKSPLSLLSTWDYSAQNRVPFAMAWSAGSVDAEMGAVQTQTWQQKDGGGYWAYQYWGQTSMTSPPPGPTNRAYMMLNTWNWTYQINQYELFEWAPETTTTSKRLAWGANYGAVGQQSYPVYGDDGNLSGYPYQSYSVFMVLGRHSQEAVMNQVRDIEAVHDASLSANVGSVRVQGPAGINRPDLTTYSPAGYNPVYGTWDVEAAANRIDVTFDAEAGALHHPILVVHNFTAAAPQPWKVAGSTWTANKDFLPARMPRQINCGLPRT
ncbi:MAG: hypothetical protein R3C68_18810, partial [Myxococcota bacterium]